MWKKVVLVENRVTSQELAEYQVEGACNQCGECCICWFYDVPDQPAEIAPRKGWCPHLDLDTKKCRIWNKRPEGCRIYPTVRDIESGNVPKGCGFRLVKRGGKLNG